MNKYIIIIVSVINGKINGFNFLEQKSITNIIPNKDNKINIKTLDNKLTGIAIKLKVRKNKQMIIILTGL